MLRQPRWLYTFSVPAVWAVIAAENFRHSGDEYAMFFIASFPGLWPLLLFPELHSGQSPLHILPFVLGGGALVLAALGLILDKLRAPLVPILAGWLFASVFGVCYLLFIHPDFEPSIVLKGTLATYVVSSLNLSLTPILITAIVVTPIWRRLPWTRTEQRRVAS